MDGLAGVDARDVLRGLVPEIQNNHKADLIYGILKYSEDDTGTLGTADIRYTDFSKDYSALYASVGNVNNRLNGNAN